MQIGIVAKKIGLSVDAIRFYERNGLLPAPPRTPGGFRRYGENEVETLAFIRRVQGLGFRLSEIRALLRLRANRLQPCAPVQRRLPMFTAFTWAVLRAIPSAGRRPGWATSSPATVTRACS